MWKGRCALLASSQERFDTNTMEKLQKAIAEARAQREQTQVNTVAKEGRQTQAVAPSGDATPTGWDSIPRASLDTRHLRKRHVLSAESSPEAMPFDVMRTKIIQVMRQNEWRRVIITSPTPQCGKTTLATNLALGIARQGEFSATLLEFDLRRPGLSGVLGAQPTAGIKDMLAGKISFAEQAVRIGDQVAVSMALSKSSDPTRILTSSRTKSCLDEIDEAYQPDFMIFDTPPLLVNDDTSSLLPLVDCVILVARAESTTHQQIDLCEREIAEQTNMLGVILNQCRFDEGNYQYGYDSY